MPGRRLIVIVIGALAVAAIVIAVTLALTPQQTNPAYAAALAFAQAAAQGDDATAMSFLSPALRAYAAQCPEGRVSACIDSYIPPEWGAFETVVFRRAAPDPATMLNGRPTAYDVELIATYSEGLGFSGVCIYQRMEQDEAGAWRVARYAGFVSCGDPQSRGMESNPDAPNRTP